MNAVVSESNPRTVAPAIPPEAAPDLVIDWESFGRHVLAHRTMLKMGRQAYRQISGVAPAQLSKIEAGFPPSPDHFLRLCLLVERNPYWFAMTGHGWQPHPCPGRAAARSDAAQIRDPHP